MPTIAEATSTDRAGLTRVQTPASPQFPPPQSELQPQGTLMLRCPMPPVSVTPDTLRSFYLGSKVPQFRALTPGQNNTSSNANGPSTTFASSSQGGSSGTIVPPSSNTPQTAKTASVTTPALNPGHGFQTTLSVSTYKALQLLSVSVNAAARIELYGTAASQSADFSRALDAPPPAGTAQNIITDLALDTAPFRWTFQNRIAGNGDNPQKTTLYITVTNIGTSTRALTVTVTYVPMES